MSSFILKTFATLGAQILTTLYSAHYYKNKEVSSRWVWLFASICLSILMYNTRIPLEARFVLLLLFSITNGIVFSKIFKHLSNDTIRTSMRNMFTLFSLLVGLTWAYFRYMPTVRVEPIYLFVSLYVLMMVGLYLFMFYVNPQSDLTKKAQRFRYISMGIFACYVVYDTYANLEKAYDGDVVIATLDYYLDIKGLFTVMTQMRSSPISL